ncbi:MAG: hypothetical protein GY772_22285 [bacterium]|nr:hypothetical protein [bacterium]
MKGLAWLECREAAASAEATAAAAEPEAEADSGGGDDDRGGDEPENSADWGDDDEADDVGASADEARPPEPAAPPEEEEAPAEAEAAPEEDEEMAPAAPGEEMAPEAPAPEEDEMAQAPEEMVAVPPPPKLLRPIPMQPPTEPEPAPPPAPPSAPPPRRVALRSTSKRLRRVPIPSMPTRPPPGAPEAEPAPRRPTGPPPRPPPPPPRPTPVLPFLDDLPSDIARAARRAVDELRALPEPQKRPGPHEEGLHVVLCSSCFRRHWQLHMAMGPNLAQMMRWPMGVVTWLVVLPEDGEHVESEAWIKATYPAFIACELLVLARATPQEGFYHASTSKNTSHLIGMDLVTRHSADEPAAVGGSAPRKTHVLVNLDCDNIVGENFIGVVLQTFKLTRPSERPAADFAAWRGHESATTGRIALTTTAFAFLRGYDEEDTHGSGYQDVDMIKRAQRSPQLWCSTVRMRRATLEDSHREVGYPIPNAREGGLRRDRGTAKVCNCRNPRALTWGQMNEENHALMSRRLREGKVARNLGRSLGWPWEYVEVEARLALRPAPLPHTYCHTCTHPPTTHSCHPPLMPQAPPPPPPPREAPPPPAAAAPAAPAAPLAQPRLHLVIVTLGVDLLVRWFQGRRILPPPSAAHAERGALHAMRETVQVMLQASGRRTGGRLPFVIDCRPLHDPEGTRRRRGDVNHIGTDEHNLSRIVESPKFPRLWTDFVTGVTHAIQQVHGVGGSAPSAAPDPPTLVVAFFCRKGRHRSVACAWLAEQLFIERRCVVEVWHAMRDFWQLGTCNECRACAAGGPAKQAAFERACSFLP